MGREGERVQDQAHSQDFVVHFDRSIDLRQCDGDSLHKT